MLLNWTSTYAESENSWCWAGVFRRSLAARRRFPIDQESRPRSDGPARSACRHNADDVARMERQIAALVRTEEQLNILEEFLLLRLNCVQIDSRVDDALQQIERCGGELRGLTTRQGLPSELPPFGSTLAHLGGLVPQTDGEDRAVSSAAPTHRDLAGRRHCTSRGRTWLL